jgi:hypothetical protein
VLERIKSRATSTVGGADRASRAITERAPGAAPRNPACAYHLAMRRPPAHIVPESPEKGLESAPGALNKDTRFLNRPTPHWLATPDYSPAKTT